MSLGILFVYEIFRKNITWFIIKPTNEEWGGENYEVKFINNNLDHLPQLIKIKWFLQRKEGKTCTTFRNLHTIYFWWYFIYRLTFLCCSRNFLFSIMWILIKYIYVSDAASNIFKHSVRRAIIFYILFSFWKNKSILRNLVFSSCKSKSQYYV